MVGTRTDRSKGFDRLLVLHVFMHDDLRLYVAMCYAPEPKHNGRSPSGLEPWTEVLEEDSRSKAVPNCQVNGQGASGSIYFEAAYDAIRMRLGSERKLRPSLLEVQFTPDSAKRAGIYTPRASAASSNGVNCAVSERANRSRDTSLTDVVEVTSASTMPHMSSLIFWTGNPAMRVTALDSRLHCRRTRCRGFEGVSRG